MRNLIYATTLIVFLIAAFSGAAQTCGASGIVFSSQGDVDVFSINHPGCTQILGSVTIEGADISNLTGLSGTTSIGGNLVIRNNDLLTDIAGLSNLTTINSLGIDNNDALLSLAGLSSLTNIATSLDIRNNASLEDLDGLVGVTSLGGSIDFWLNPSLTSIAGLSGISGALSGNIVIRGNDALLSLTGLSGISSIGGSLDISYNAALASLSGLSGIAGSVGSLDIVACPVSDLSPLLGINSVAGSLVIRGVNAPDLSGLSNITGALAGNLDISYNEFLTNLDGLSGITQVGGPLDIVGNYGISASSALTSLTGLSGIISIGGFLRIRGTFVTDLSGISNIDPTTITDLYLEINLLSFCEVPNICTYLSNPLNPATILSNATNCTSRSAIEMACQALPVALISFIGRPSGAQNLLNWITATEINNDRFEIERSANGHGFHNIGMIPGKSNSQAAQEHSFRDSNPIKGINYYRLKQVDKDGTFAFSKMVAVENWDLAHPILYPNPAKDEIFVDIQQDHLTYLIKTTAGQIVQSGTIFQNQAINIANLPTGIYLAQVLIEGLPLTTQKLVKH